jgi:mRNA interferase MazF
MGVKDRVRGQSARLRAQGLRPVQTWVPDVHSPEFAQEAKRQSALVAASAGAKGDQAFVDDLSEWEPCVKQGEVWTAAGGVYASKSHPVVIIQDDHFGGRTSVTVLPMNTTLVDAPLIRVPVEPSSTNGLEQLSHIMIDKVTITRRSSVPCPSRLVVGS